MKHGVVDEKDLLDDSAIHVGARLKGSCLGKGEFDYLLLFFFVIDLEQLTHEFIEGSYLPSGGGRGGRLFLQETRHDIHVGVVLYGDALTDCLLHLGLHGIGHRADYPHLIAETQQLTAQWLDITVDELREI